MPVAHSEQGRLHFLNDPCFCLAKKSETTCGLIFETSASQLHSKSNEMDRQLPSLRLSLAQALFGATLAVAESHRQLEEWRDGESRDSGDDYDYDDQGDDRFQVLYDAEERIEGDIKNMWKTSPADWITEYWEVFAAMCCLLFFLILCFCVECCFCCSSGKDGSRRRIVATSSQMEEEQKAWNARQQAKEQAKKQAEEASKGGWSLFGFGSSKGKESVSRSVPSPTALAAPIVESDAVETPAVQSPRQTKTRSTSEFVGKTLDLVVDLWSEFLFGKDKKYRRAKSPRRRKHRVSRNDEDEGAHYTNLV